MTAQQTQTLADFLLARIAEDEADARGAIADTRDGAFDHWLLDDEGSVRLAGLGATVAVGPWGSGLHKEGPHIARHDPARVLAECDAKRRIVEHAEVVSGMDSRIEGEWGTRGSVPWNEDEGVRLLRLLALPYSAHPDFRPEWTP